MKYSKGKYELITFEEVKQTIKSIIKSDSDKRFDLIPGNIIDLIQSKGIIIKKRKIKNWHQFETGLKVELTLDEILKDSKINKETNEALIIVTDECFQNKLAIKISSKTYKHFESEVYPEIYGMDLIQPLDLILLQEITNTIFILHHEGVMFEI